MNRNKRFGLITASCLLSILTLSSCSLPSGVQTTAQPSISFDAEEELHTTSRIDERGIAKIMEKNSITLDITDNLLTKEEIGFNPEKPSPSIRTTDGSLIDVKIKTDIGDVNMKVDTVTFKENRADPHIYDIALFRPFPEVEKNAIIQEIEDSVEKYDIKQEDVNAWVKSMKQESTGNHDAILSSSTNSTNNTSVVIEVKWNEGDGKRGLTYHVYPKSNIVSN